ncbi:MAG: YgfZ/GcvT domain-containing protein [Opitutaceae bacterium]
MDATYFFRSKPAGRLLISGPDAAMFLQGQFSNDLRRPAGSSTYGLWLNHKGRVLADSFVLRLSEMEFEIVSTSSPAATIAERLESFIIADDVSVADRTAGAASLTVAGPAAREILSKLRCPAPTPENFSAGAGGTLVFRGRSAGRRECWHVLLPAAQNDAARESADAALAAVGATEAPPSVFDRCRIADGVPAIPIDLGPGDLPQEGGLEAEAVSFNKGCYLGQEVMARLQSLGKVRRRLFVVGSSEAGDLTTGAELFREDRKLGQIRSSLHEAGAWTGLAILSAQGLNAGDRLLTSGGAEVGIVALAEGRAW